MVGRRTSRRQFLVSVGIVGLAGCTGIRPGDEPGGTDTATPTATSTTTDSPAEGTATAAGTETETATETQTTGTDSPTTESPETVQFQSTAGTEVTGSLYGGRDGACGVVLVPQINLDRGSWQPQAERLAGIGHLVLAIDEDPNNRAESARGALKYLRRTVGVDRILLVGASSGGEAVVRADARAETGTVQGLVTLSAAGGVDVAEDLQGRKLFVVSENDDDRFVRTAKQLHEKAPEPKALKIYSGSAHGQGIFDTTHGDDLADRLFGLVEDVCT